MGSKTDQTNLTEEQLRALCHPMRIRIVHLLGAPRTPKQVAAIINIRPNNLYYHFRVLEKAGIIEKVETRKGRGFIKENFFRLKEEDIPLMPESAPLSDRLGFFHSFIRAATQDLNEAIGKYDDVAAVGSRDDFSIPESALDDAINIISRRVEKLMTELGEYHHPNRECSYQVNLFSFRL